MTSTRFAQAAGTLLTLVAAVSNSGSAADVIPQFVARDGAFHVVRDGQDTRLFVHAVNLGVGVPGTQPGALAATESQYTNWLRQIGGMGFRAVRIYTLHYPRFYKALRDYNLNNPEAPLYLFHGVWLDEENPSGTYDLHAFTPIFTDGITQAVRAVHGDITIPDRWGRAYGAYTNDVSPWVLGWIIGREIYAYEVDETNQAHTNDTSFVGTHLSLPVGSPAECWVTARLDDLARYEQEEFGTGRPISFSCWPTLDPLYHPSENSHTGEDSEAVDLANLDTPRFAPGYFASYHVYSFYPDFNNGDPAYTMVQDLEGPNSYLGTCGPCTITTTRSRCSSPSSASPRAGAMRTSPSSAGRTTADTRRRPKGATRRACSTTSPRPAAGAAPCSGGSTSGGKPPGSPPSSISRRIGATAGIT